MTAPQVSVVMGVFNGATSLAATLDSVLQQQGCEFEFIVVDDGSTDATAEILRKRAANDARLRVIRQDSNAGLTTTLASGCALARGEFIARQDCGDLSLPGRLARQARLLGDRADCVMTACGVRTVGPGREPLFVTIREGAALHDGLDPASEHAVIGPPHHGATMFRRHAYESVKGYRPFFVVAQDIDLWLRLRELGACLGDAGVGYEASLEAGSISASRRTEQLRFAAIAKECARRRGVGAGEDDLLTAPKPAWLHQDSPANSRRGRAKFLYFVGACLAKTDPAAATRYYRQALREYPFHVKSLVRLLFR